MPRLLLLRHGQSAWNAERRWQGHADPPLSEQGERDATQAAAAIAGADSVVSSDLRRARRTAELIAARLGVGLGESYPALRERDVGEWSGLTPDEVDLRYPGRRAAGIMPPGWESDRSLVARVMPVLGALVASGGNEIVVVSHGGVLRAVEQHLGAEGPAATADNLCGRWLEERGGGLVLGARVELLGR